MRCPRTGLKVQLIEISYKSFVLRREDGLYFDADPSYGSNRRIWINGKWACYHVEWHLNILLAAFKQYKQYLAINWLVEGF